MLKALGQSAVDAVEDMVSFLKNFKEYAKNIISKIGALFVQELFQLIKKDILNLIQQIICGYSKRKVEEKNGNDFKVNWFITNCRKLYSRF